MKMRHLCGKKVYAVTILGLLMILTIGGGLFCSFSTHQSLQSIEASPVSLHTAAATVAVQWNTTWGGAAEDDGNGVAVDANGSIYCIGKTRSYGAGDYDFALVKFAPNGTRLWNTTWGSYKYNVGRGVAVDANGSIYCIGSTSSFTGFPGNLALVKFAPNGTKLWNITWGGVSSEDGWSVAVDANGSVYCLGNINDGGSYMDWALVKFTPNGKQLWNTTWGGTDSDDAYDIAVDINGYIYCTGMTDSFGTGIGANLAVVKYSPEGEQLWNTTPSTMSSFGFRMMVDTSGFVYCTGKTLNYAMGNYDLVLFKFAPNGVQLWNITWGSNLDDCGYGLAMDANGALYCSGYADHYSTDYNVVLFKFAPDGTILAITTWGGVSGDLCYDMAVDASGLIYCVGSTSSSGAGDSDFMLVKFRYTAGPELPDGIPGFELFYLLIGLLMLVYLAHRAKANPN